MAALFLTATFTLAPGDQVADLVGTAMGNAPFLVLPLFCAAFLPFVLFEFRHKRGPLLLASLAALCLSYLSAPLVAPATRVPYALANGIWLCLGLLAALVWPRVDWAVKGFVACATIQAGAAIWGYLSQTNGVFSGSVFRPMGTYSTHIELYLLLIVAVCLALGTPTDPRETKCKVAAVTLLLVATFLAGTRNSWIGLFAAVPLILIKARVPRMVTFGVVVGLVVALSLSDTRRNATPKDQASTTRSNASRALVWQAGIEEFRRAPISGVGIGQISLDVTVDRNGRNQTLSVYDPKNQLLFMLIEFGLPGGIVFTILTALSIIRSARHGAVGVAIAAALVAVAAAGLFDTPMFAFGRTNTAAIFSFLIGCTVLLHRRALGASEADSTEVKLWAQSRDIPVRQ